MINTIESAKQHWNGVQCAHVVQIAERKIRVPFAAAAADASCFLASPQQKIEHQR